jgi:DNA-binding response OmpR family regulator
MARILVADDEVNLVNILEKSLVRDGHTVVTAYDGIEALRRLSLGDIDLVVIDMVMPNMNGLDAIKEMQKKYPKVKIIAISGGGNRGGPRDYLDVAKQLGASQCLFKPFMLNELSARIKDLLTPTPLGPA